MRTSKPCLSVSTANGVSRNMMLSGKQRAQELNALQSVILWMAKPDVLRIFLGQLDEVLDGRGVGTLKEITKDKKSDLKGPVKIVVTSRNEYRKSFENVPSATLKTLILSGIGLKKVDTRWFSCSLLTSLHLSKNQMNSITDLVKMRLIGRLVNLQVLNMSHNGLMRLPIEMMASFPPSLLHLDLSFNLFRSIPSFSYMPSLTILNMANNRLEILPHDLRNRRSVSFNFDNNQIKFLPCMSSNVRQTFSITGNSLNESVSSVDLSLMKCPSRLQWAMQSIKINRIRVEESIKARFWEEEGIDFCDYCAIPLAAD
ncbi:hypothetical protein PENTCL1PPCAC_6924, partial [Pristionchus entomophagus]